MTGYVSTRYYRAPEIMLTWQEYSEKVDIWSTGCIFAEMLRGTPLFPATSHADQFTLFVNLLGNPEPRIVDMIKNRHVSSLLSELWVGLKGLTRTQTRAFVQSMPPCKREPLSKTFPGLDEDGMSHSLLLTDTVKILTYPAMDILEQMLDFDVEKRTGARDALSHPYLAPYHDPTDEPVVRIPFDWRFDNAEVSIEAWKAAV
jgi:p38 MAP kinase